MSRVRALPIQPASASTADAVEAGGPGGGQQRSAPVVVPLRHWGRWIAAALVLVVAGALVSAFATNPDIDWSAVPRYLFSGSILRGLWHTLLLALLAQGVGIALGVLLAAMRLSENPVTRSVSWLYIWLFRGTPLLVQLIFWFNLGLVFHTISLSVPFTGLTLFSESTNTLITPFAAALLGLALNEGAYMAEIVRGGLLGVERGQTEAAYALGMTPGLTLRRIVLPQAIRIIIPPTGNEFINMLKTTSLASVIAYDDLLNGAKNIYNQNLQTFELLIVASIWYLVATSILTIGQFYLERHYARGSSAALAPSLVEVWKRSLTLRRMVKA
ncbi:MAG: amino acid ABC transporter permease [Actinobacteria bacterium]|nr:amino acid ABC transporter permease [Actinomycetota bacterium]